MTNFQRISIFFSASILISSVSIIYALHSSEALPPVGLPINTQATGSHSTIGTVRFLAVGDIMLSRGVHSAIEKKHDPLLPLRGIQHMLQQVDFTFGNFESPVSGSSFYGKDDSLVFNTKETSLRGLVENNMTVLHLANNHILDQRVAGLEHTLSVFETMGLQTVGVGKTKEEAWEAHIVEKNAVRIAFIGASYTAYNDGGKRSSPHVALLQETQLLQKSILDAKTKADVIIVSMHAGKEYTRTPNKEQKSFAKNAIDYGADMVIGHHPHWIQPIEWYKEKPIIYSLGNFIFDQNWSQETKEGLVLQLAVTKNHDHSSLHIEKYIPIIIEHGTTPRPATQKEKERILQYVQL